jgi:hypothetical protein
LTFDDERADFNPACTCANDNTRLAVVWARSDYLNEQLKQQISPDETDRLKLKAFLTMQLPTLVPYGQMHVFMTELKKNVATSKTISLYILLFPGEARDNTGIKDLNEKVIGQWWSAQFQQKRFDAIDKIFFGDGFLVAAQTYKTAFIMTYERDRKAFAAKLALLDEALRVALLDTLKDAMADKSVSVAQKKEIEKLSDKLRKKGYRFDIFFGHRKLAPKNSSSLTNVYLLVTEAMKGAALARYVAKANTVGSGAIGKVAAKPGIRPDPKKLDARGKEYDWKVYMRTSSLAEEIKSMVLKGTLPGVALELNPIYVDTVWTFCYVEYRNLYWGNADTVRDVRKKKLGRPPKGNVSSAYGYQKDLLELWLVILNMLDFVKRFKSEEFDDGTLKKYHDRALKAYFELDNAQADITWDNLRFVLTHDVRQADPIAVIDTASEFQFYATVSEYRQRIFVSMDVRDMGVELMLSHEKINRDVSFQKYSDLDLMMATFRSDDPIDTRRRLTYDTVVAMLRKYHGQIARSQTSTLTAAQQAFGGNVDGHLGSFAESVQVMLGGDEVYIALHPLFMHHVPAIIGDLQRAPYQQDRTLDLRASVAFSSAEKTDVAKQRQTTQLSHQEALKLAEVAPSKLKALERTKRRIERLIDMIEANPKKQKRAAGYRQELAKLPLTDLFARVKYGHPQSLAQKDFAKLCAALLTEDPAAVSGGELFDLVDFTGKVINAKQLVGDAKALEEKVRLDVGKDNVRVQAPPLYEIPKWIKALIDALLKDKDPKKDK